MGGRPVAHRHAAGDAGARGDEDEAGDGGALGSVVAGVRLTSWLGSGSSGSVWAGTDEATGERVAVKLLRDATASSGRWPAEARVLQEVDLPHLLALRRVGTDPPAVVTELAVGGSLASQVRARGPLEAGEVVTVLLPLADTLAGLHRRDVVHGDVSGGNVLFVDLGRPVLADLGAASAARRGRRRGAVPGTPGYAAPEVLAGGPPSGPADVHGLGAVAWLALTGAAPPVAGDRLPLRLLAPECPDGLVDLVLAMLDPDPARRPAPADVARRARAAAPARPVRLVPAAARGVPAEEALTSRVDGWSPGGGGRRRGTGWRVAALTAAALVALAACAAGLAGVLPPVGGDAPRAAPLPAPAAPHPAPATTPTALVATPPGPAAPSPVPAVPAPRSPDGPVGPTATEPLHARVTRLVGAREAALRRGDAAAAARVHVPGTAFAGADERLTGRGPLDVRFEVTSVVPVADDVADVGLLTRWGGGAAVPERVRVRLVEDGGRWLLADVRTAPAPTGAGPDGGE
ncbi:serine/threonine-protein kinase [Aquipuribacter sp. SD81]|uniref:serine/threonine-protein kinase n=1 Tax=Aquipuribacter sp. SD81 TaxID=3127703 RepID=UPI003015E581